MTLVALPCFLLSDFFPLLSDTATIPLDDAPEPESSDTETFFAAPADMELSTSSDAYAFVVIVAVTAIAKATDKNLLIIVTKI